MKVDAHVWQFGVDYPGLGGADDSKLPLRSVNVKAWDQVYWMSNFDGHAAAVSGPAQIAKLVSTYKAQGIDLLLWCVPKGRNVAAMLSLAKKCVDVPGVKGLVMDVEPFSGFCAGDCSYLASTFMKQLRAARPKAWLGVTYDPRPQHWGPSGTTEWLKYANGALPMMYWESFKTNVQPWPDPVASIKQAHSDLRNRLAPSRNLEFFPILQGNTSPAKMTAALEAVKATGSTRASTWRRGVVPVNVWQATASVAEPAPPVEPPPPVDPCKDVKTQLAQCQARVRSLGTAVDAQLGTIAARDAKIVQLNVRIAELRGDLTICQASELERKKFVDALGIVKDYLASL